MTILCTCPGKLGDLLYALPAINSLKEELRPDRFDFLTSDYCRSLVPLLKHLNVFDNIYIDTFYKPTTFGYGMQPADMPTDKWYRSCSNIIYDKIFCFGFVREILGNIFSYCNLAQVHYATLKLRYGVDLNPTVNSPFIDPLGSVSKNKTIIFHGYSESLHCNPKYTEAGEALNKIWADLFKIFKSNGINVVAITDLKQHAFHKTLCDDVRICTNAVQTLQYICSSRAFVGVQSFPFVIAEGLKWPRIVSGIFNHVLPAGNNGKYFYLHECAEDIFTKMQPWLQDLFFFPCDLRL